MVATTEIVATTAETPTATNKSLLLDPLIMPSKKPPLIVFT